LHETVAVGVDHIYANDFDGMHITNPLIGEALRRCAAGLVIVTMVVAIRKAKVRSSRSALGCCRRGRSHCCLCS